MSDEALQNWLKRQIARRAMGCRVGALFALVGGVVVLFLTFWLSYVVLFISERSISAVGDLAFNHKLHLTHVWRLAICGLFVLALFIERLRRSPWDMGNYSSARGVPFSNTLVFFGGVMGSLAAVLANPQGTATMATELLYTGPRLVLGAWQLNREAQRLAHMELAACAWVLAYLAAHPKAVTYEELGAAWPDADWPQIRADLAHVPGVVFLEKGLSLTGELRSELREKVYAPL